MLSEKDYFEELELMKNQNQHECDLYPLIYVMISHRENTKNISVRTVADRRRSKRGQVFYGLSAFPDLVILDKNFNNNDNANGEIANIDQVYGCIEVKNPWAEGGKKLLNVLDIIDELRNNGCFSDDAFKEDKGELIGELFWYKKMIYTNGYDWQYIEWTSCDNEYEIIKNAVQHRIDNDDNGNLVDYIKEAIKNSQKISAEDLNESFINFCNNITITVKELGCFGRETKNNYTREKNWQKFNKEILSITWKNKK